MSHFITLRKYWVFLCLSVVLNIFLLAFLLGRISMFGMMPPPPFMMGGGPHMVFGMHGHMPPPPHHLFEPETLFSPVEMKENFTQMQENFDKIERLRKDFAEKLRQSVVTKEEVMKHFSDIDAIMNNVRVKTQEKAAEKMSTMSAQERTRFADMLLSEDKEELRGHPPGPPPGHSPEFP